MVVLEALPEHAGRESLSVVHVSFAGVISQHSVDHDFFFSFIEPAVLAAKSGRGLGGGRWNVEPRYDSDKAGQTAFESKEPAPASDAVDTAHV